MTKNSVCHSISQELTSYDFDLCIYGTNDNISSIFFFNFINILIFPGEWAAGRGALKAKNSPQKTLSVPPNIWGTIHQMIVICCTRVWADDISRHFFSKFWFFSKGVKHAPKWEKILPVALHNLGTVHHMIAIRGREM